MYVTLQCSFICYVGISPKCDSETGISFQEAISFLVPTSFSECFLWRGPGQFFVMMSESLFSDRTNRIFTIPFSQSQYSLTNLLRISTCLVLLDVVIFSDKNMAPTLSTLTITGKWTSIFILFSSHTRKIMSFTDSDNATHSASQLLRVTHLWAFDFQQIGTPCT